MPTRKVATLGDVAADMRAWADTLEGLEGDGQEGPAREQALVAQAQAIAEGADKVERFCWFVKRCDAQAALYKAEESALRDKRKALEAISERLLALAETHLVDNKLPVLIGHTMKLQMDGCPPSVEIKDEALIPQKYKYFSMRLNLENWATFIANCRKVAGALWPEIWQTITQDPGFIHGQVEVSRAALATDLKEGIEIPGADLTISNKSVRIK